MKNLVPVIGLEIHAQVNSETKMFCRCTNSNFGLEPNTAVCPVCMGFPGALPMPNEAVVQKALQAALAIGCEIPEKSKFDRKNYFYPDLPAGYQISQFDEPLSKNGKVEYELNGVKKVCRINRLHIENDAGKLVHMGGNSYCDYNRAGSPLMEIVTEPDLRTAEEASAFVQELARILQFVGASECDMFKGQMRFDASVSLRESEAAPLTPRSEIKNLNSFRALEQALHYELKRQAAEWEKRDGPPEKECTVGWVDDIGETKFMRWKESAADYRYFPEPDLPPLVMEPKHVEKTRKSLPELPLVCRARYEKELGLTTQDAFTLVDNPKLCLFYEAVAKESGEPKKAVNWVLHEVLGLLKRDAMEIVNLKYSASELALLIQKVESGEISGKQAKTILEELHDNGGSVEKIIAEKGLTQVSDTSELEKIIAEILATPEGQDAVAQYKKGRERALGFVVGEVMKKTHGNANPGLVNKILLEQIK